MTPADLEFRDKVIEGLAYLRVKAEEGEKAHADIRTRVTGIEERVGKVELAVTRPARRKLNMAGVATVAGGAVAGLMEALRK